MRSTYHSQSFLSSKGRCLLAGMMTMTLLLLLSASANASPKQDLHSQVKLELKGNPKSCQLMTPDYQSLFVGAAEWFNAGDSCGDGVKVMAGMRRQNNPKAYSFQASRLLKAIGRARRSSSAPRSAKLIVRYQGTPPGWSTRPKSHTVEVYKLIFSDGVWRTDNVTARVRPPLARIAR